VDAAFEALKTHLEAHLATEQEDEEAPALSRTSGVGPWGAWSA
jgi:hypothetical protein